MLGVLKKLIPFKVKRRYWRYLKNRERIKKQRIKFDGKSPKEAFTFIYNTNYWSGEQSISGGGSDLANTQTVITELSALLKSFNIASVLDLPCGDFLWMQYVDLKSVKYIGGDIVNELIVANNKQYKQKNKVQFETIDLLQDKLPQSDIIINRDCLVHLSYNHIYKVLVNIKNSGSKYLLTTTFTDVLKNESITTGDWRVLNLEKPPFNFPPPIKIINENLRNPEYKDKSLGLWLISDLAVPNTIYSQ